MYWNPRRPPATAGRGRRSLVRALLVFFLSLGLLSGICLFVSPKPQSDSFYQAVSQPAAAVSSAFALPGLCHPRVAPGCRHKQRNLHTPAAFLRAADAH